MAQSPDKQQRQPSTQWKFWREARVMELEPYYCYWVSHLTSEALHDKADIATVLAILHQQRDDMQADGLRLHKDKMDLWEKVHFPPTDDEIAAYRDLFRSELDKRMDTKHPSASPSTEAHEIALRAFVEGRSKGVARSHVATPAQGETPRTDYAATLIQFAVAGKEQYEVVTAEFARQLERELAEVLTPNAGAIHLAKRYADKRPQNVKPENGGKPEMESFNAAIALSREILRITSRAV